MWWLILHVNMIRLRNAQIVSKISFLGVSVRVSWKRLAFETIEWIKKVTLTNLGDYHPILTLSYWRQNKKAEKVWILCLFLSWTPITFWLWKSHMVSNLQILGLNTSTPPLPVLSTSTLDWGYNIGSAGSHAFELKLNYTI